MSFVPAKSKRVPQYVFGYGFAALAVGVAAAIKLALDPLIREESPFLLFFAAVMLVAIVGGLGPGLLATFASALTADLMFLNPGSVLLQESGENLRLGIFLVEGAAISTLSVALTSSRGRAVDSLGKLERSEARYRAVVEQSEEGIFMLNARTLRVNESNFALQRILGYTAEELRDMSVYELVEDSSDIVQRSLQRPLDETVTGGPSAERSAERRYRKKDGTLLTVEATASYIEYGDESIICVHVRDVTQRIRQQSALSQSEDRLRLAAEAVGLGIWDYHPSSSEVGCDERTRYLFGLPPAGGVSYEMILEKIHDEDRVEVRRVIEEALETHGPYTRGYSIRFRVSDTPDGIWRWISAQGKAFAYPEDSVGKRLVGTVLDITGIKEAEEAAEQARENERSRIARELHDGALQEIVYALQEAQISQELTVEPPPYLQTISDSLRLAVEELRSAIFELRLEETTARSSRESLEALADLGRRMSRNAYTIKLSVADSFPDDVDTQDMRQILRVIQEALTNARRYAEPSLVDITLGVEGPNIIVEVTDDGKGFVLGAGRIGIGSRSMQERARGLGGQLSVYSTPGEGTRVRLCLPAKQIDRLDGP